MREINPDLREFVLATMPGPQPAEFAALHKQHPRCRFTWHVSSPGGSAEELDGKPALLSVLLLLLTDRLMQSCTARPRSC